MLRNHKVDPPEDVEISAIMGAALRTIPEARVSSDFNASILEALDTRTMSFGSLGRRLGLLLVPMAASFALSLGAIVILSDRAPGSADSFRGIEHGDAVISSLDAALERRGVRILAIGAAADARSYLLNNPEANSGTHPKQQ